MMFSIRPISRLADFAPAQGRYTWNERDRKFRDARGKLVSRTRIRLALDEYLDNLADETKGLALRLVEGSISIGDWQVAMEKIVKRGHTSATAIAKGGWQQAKAADWARAAVRIKFNYGKLDQFARQLERGDVALDGRFVRRAMMYALAPTGTYEDVLRADDIKAGFDRERRVLHSKSPCIDCFRYAALGWVKAGTLPGIGQKCQCKANCRCRFERIRSVIASNKRRKP